MWCCLPARTVGEGRILISYECERVRRWEAMNVWAVPCGCTCHRMKLIHRTAPLRWHWRTRAAAAAATTTTTTTKRPRTTKSKQQTTKKLHTIGKQIQHYLVYTRYVNWLSITHFADNYFAIGLGYRVRVIGLGLGLTDTLFPCIVFPDRTLTPTHPCP